MIKLDRLSRVKMPFPRLPEEDTRNEFGEYIPPSFSEFNINCALETYNEDLHVFPEGARISDVLFMIVRWKKRMTENDFIQNGKIIYNDVIYKIIGVEEITEMKGRKFRHRWLRLHLSKEA